MAKFSDESVRAALAGRGQVRRYALPFASDVYVGIKVPTDEAIDGARLRAVDFCKKRKVDPKFDPDFLEHAITREVLSLAFVDADNHDDAFFSDADEVAELDPAMVSALHEMYMSHFMAMDPYAFVSGDEAEELADALGKSESPEERLSVYDSRTLRALLLSTASRLRETRASRSSDTT